MYRFIKYKSFFFATLLLAIAMSSCEKVIDIDLQEGTETYVIEANLTDEAGSAKVLLSKTKPFSANNSFNGVTGAVVTLQEEGGAPVILSPTQNGVYQHASFAGTPTKTYQLKVEINGETFTAESTMPAKVNMDTAYADDVFVFTETRKLAVVKYQDPANVRNYYRFIQYVDGIRESQLMLDSDDYSDGLLNTSRLYYYPEDDDDPSKILPGKQVKIEMLCISADTHKYWRSLSSGSTGSSISTPANPVSNINGGALGYFSAHTYQSKTFIVQP